MTPVVENSLHKAAVFVRGLAPDAAEAMLGRLTAEEARVLRAAIAQLDNEHRNGTVSDSSSPSVSADGTVELQLSSPAPNEPIAAPTRAATQPLDGAAWLRQLRDADPQAIADYLSREQPRAIAVVLGYLPAELGASVLQCLPDEEQSKVVAQLAEQGDADPDSLRVIAAGLSDWVQRKQEEHRRRSTRVATIRQIVAATPEHKRRSLLATLSATEPEIAASLADLAPAPKPAPVVEAKPSTPAPQPRRPALTMDDLRRVDGRALAEAIGKLDARTALLALAAAPTEILANLTAGLPRAAAKDLRQRIHRVGPTTLAEIDRAQAAFAMAVEDVVGRRRSQRSLQPQGA